MDHIPLQTLGIQLRLDDEQRRLQAVYVVPSGDDVTVGAVSDISIQQELETQGYGNLFVLKDGIKALVKIYQKPGEQGSIEIAEKRDARCQVAVARDHMSATISTEQAYGGEPLNHERILTALSEAGVQYGIDVDAVKGAVERGNVHQFNVAQGTPAIQGEDAHFELLASEEGERGPAVQENGRVDYREMHVFDLVSPNDKLMRRHPATSGQNGKDVMGSELVAKSGHDKPFSKSMKGAELTANDPDLLIAAIAGKATFTENGATIDPVLTLKRVDLSTGNIEFDGAVNVSGDVAPGMHIKVTGDVLISGMVEAATIQAGGDIQITGGVIGNGEIENETDELEVGIARIHADGRLTARFVENAWLEAHQVTIGDSVVHSVIHAGDEVFVGAQHANRGHIIGGITRAGRLVTATVLGSPASSGTEVYVGSERDLHAEIEKIEQTKNDKSAERDKLLMIFTSIEKKPKKVQEQLVPKLENNLEQIERDVEALQAKKERFQQQLEGLNQVKVVVSKSIHSSVDVGLNRLRWRSIEDIGGRVFVIKDRAIALVSEDE